VCSSDLAAALAAQLDQLNQQRRGLQDQMQTEALGQVEDLLAALEQQELPPALCLFEESWHQGIVGLVASRIKDAVHRPVFAFAPEAAGSSLLKGSARSVKGLHIRDVLAYVDSRSPGLMKAFGGHAMAAGLSLDRENLEVFEDRLTEAVRVVLDGAELTAEILADGELAADELTLGTAELIENSGPWGQRFPEPLFDGTFNVLESRVVGGSHLKMIVRSTQGGEELDAIAFLRLPEDLPQSGIVRLLYHLSVNRWRGNASCQLMVEEIVK
jgi:single-stranded-DNA-specific exonuclease